MEFLRDFGLQPTLLLAQIVNFLVILFVLKRFFYKPIVKMLDDRKQKIEESLKNADTIEEKLKETEEKTAKILEESRKNAQDIITEAQKEAERIAQEASKEARVTIEHALSAAREQIESERQAARKQVEKEMLDLVALVIKKVLGSELGPKEKQSLTAKAISEIQKQTH
ncbi:MAG: F0F1 ATP synthase subunit B [Candidatus Curtissbacteria bacterium]|nr:F0F1 ATP synthase subunit B [Candidatus Curtissbacteria bacterium]